jgi:hypothetical protein
MTDAVVRPELISLKPDARQRGCIRSPPKAGTAKAVARRTSTSEMRYT